MPSSGSKTTQKSARPKKAAKGSWDIELTLTRADLDAMPDELRHQLLAYLDQHPSPRRIEGTASRLERQQVAALLRETSFHKQGRPLRALLDRFAYDNDADAPTRQQLAHLLPAAGRARVGQYIAMLNHLAAKAAKDPKARLCSNPHGDTGYAVDPTTRRWLRELLPGIERAGEQEEPLWG